MQIIKKKVSPGGIEYGVTLSIWQAMGIAAALIISVVLMLAPFFVWWVSNRRRERAD
jgi:hypothetical protein